MVTMEKTCNVLVGLKPILLMILVQVMFTGINVCYKLAVNDGMDMRVLVAYRYLFGAAFIVPIAFFSERKKRQKLTWTVIFQAFLAGLFGGALGQNLYLESLALTSATFAAAMTNLVPAFTFIVAFCLRLENVGWNTKAGITKVLGTIVGIGGAMLFTFYKGPTIEPWKTNINLLHPTGHHVSKHLEGSNPTLGIVLALISCICFSLWLIIQAKAVESYRSSQSFTALFVLMGAIQSSVAAVCVQRDQSQWRLGWNIRLLTVAYSGVVGSGIMFSLMGICIRMRGPLFVSVFNPLLLILVAIAGSLFLNEKLYLGNVLGAVLIIFGVYAVLWGKGKEIKKLSRLVPENIPGEQDQVRQIKISIPCSLESVDSRGKKDVVGEGVAEIMDSEAQLQRGD